MINVGTNNIGNIARKKKLTAINSRKLATGSSTATKKEFFQTFQPINTCQITILNSKIEKGEVYPILTQLYDEDTDHRLSLQVPSLPKCAEFNSARHYTGSQLLKPFHFCSAGDPAIRNPAKAAHAVKVPLTETQNAFMQLDSDDDDANDFEATATRNFGASNRFSGLDTSLISADIGEDLTSASGGSSSSRKDSRHSSGFQYDDDDIVLMDSIDMNNFESNTAKKSNSRCTSASEKVSAHAVRRGKIIDETGSSDTDFEEDENLQDTPPKRQKSMGVVQNGETDSLSSARCSGRLIRSDRKIGHLLSSSKEGECDLQGSGIFDFRDKESGWSEGKPSHRKGRMMNNEHDLENVCKKKSRSSSEMEKLENAEDVREIGIREGEGGGEEENVWTCSVCTLENAVEEDQCSACGQQKSINIGRDKHSLSLSILDDGSDRAPSDSILDLEPHSGIKSTAGKVAEDSDISGRNDAEEKSSCEERVSWTIVKERVGNAKARTVWVCGWCEGENSLRRKLCVLCRQHRVISEGAASNGVKQEDEEGEEEGEEEVGEGGVIVGETHRERHIPTVSSQYLEFEVRSSDTIHGSSCSSSSSSNIRRDTKDSGLGRGVGVGVGLRDAPDVRKIVDQADSFRLLTAAAEGTDDIYKQSDDDGVVDGENRSCDGGGDSGGVADQEHGVTPSRSNSHGDVLGKKRSSSDMAHAMQSDLHDRGESEIRGREEKNEGKSARRGDGGVSDYVEDDDKYFAFDIADDEEEEEEEEEDEDEDVNEEEEEEGASQAWQNYFSQREPVPIKSKRTSKSSTKTRERSITSDSGTAASNLSHSRESKREGREEKRAQSDVVDFTYSDDDVEEAQILFPTSSTSSSSSSSSMARRGTDRGGDKIKQSRSSQRSDKKITGLLDLTGCGSDEEEGQKGEDNDIIDSDSSSENIRVQRSGMSRLSGKNVGLRSAIKIKSTSSSRIGGGGGGGGVLGSAEDMWEVDSDNAYPNSNSYSKSKESEIDKERDRGRGGGRNQFDDIEDDSDGSEDFFSLSRSAVKMNRSKADKGD